MDEKRGSFDSKDVLSEIERRSKDMLRSNEELASRLKQNQAVLSKFSEEFENLRQEVSGSDVDQNSKKQLEKIKAELEDKKRLISGMIDDLKPVEMDISRREGMVNDFKERIDGQTSKIELLSKDLLENRRQVEFLISSNNELKMSIAEKDGLIKVLKDKLNEKTTILRGVDDRNHKLEQEIENYKKELFALENKIGAVENRVFSTNEQNQKILYELLKSNERIKTFDAKLAEKDLLLESQNVEYGKAVEKLNKENLERKEYMLSGYMKKISVLNATIDVLKSKLVQQQKSLDTKSAKEREIISEFSTKMREVLSNKSIVNVDDMPYGDNSELSLEPPIAPEESSDEANALFDVSSIPNAPSKLDEIIPMIELAMDHGDDVDAIKHSLISSGYTNKNINEALTKLNLVEKF